jgi:uncharacterized protein (TIGR03067 family)
MKRLSWYALALTLVSGALIANVRADDKKDDKDKTDKVAAEDKKFEGTWQVTKEVHNGRAIDEDRVSRTTFVFKGKKYEQKIGDEVVEAGTQDLDPTKSPKHMDVTVSKGDGTEGLKQLAIYEIDGDTIKACFANHGEKERPTKLESKEDSGHIYIEMKRKK